MSKPVEVTTTQTPAIYRLNLAGSPVAQVEAHRLSFDRGRWWLDGKQIALSSYEVVA